MMFSQNEKAIICRDFFRIKTLGDAVVELQSENKDWWILMDVERYIPRKKMRKGVQHERYYQLLHRHSNAFGYHEHGEFSNVLDAVLEIINHDDYRLKRAGYTHFDELLDEEAANSYL